MATIFDIANSFLLLDEQNDGEGLSNMKLQKLIYYAQGFHLALFSKPLFSDNIEAWRHGAVVPNLYQRYKNYGKTLLPLADDEAFDKLTTDEFNLLEEIYQVFGQFSAWKLRNMTHEETPWLNHEGDASIIPQLELETYFKTRINE